MTDMRDILRAASLLSRHLPPTPMWSYPVLNAVAGAELWVKHENTQPIGAFKVRGGITLLAALPGRERGVVAYSTGNHAQSIAFAARLFGTECAIVMPENPNPAKVAAVEALGGRVVVGGATMVEAADVAREEADRLGWRLISPADEPEIIAGVGTLYLEILRDQPDLDAIVVPVGSGTGAAAACLVARALAPGCQVIGVQSAAAPAAHDSWRLGEMVARPMKTRVDGLATGSAYALPQQVMREVLTDFLLVTDDEIRAAQRLMLTHAHTLAEGAGAAALAGVLSGREEFAGKKVAIVVSGGNAGPAELAALLPSGA